jgi:hypothetical protein
MSYIFSSDPANGDQSVSDDGSEFSVVLYNPIGVPDNTKYCTIEVQGANIWNSSPNISASRDNNTFAFFDGTANQVVTIPKGLYDLSQLASAIAVQIDNIPANLPSEQLFSFSGDQSTQEVLITFLSENLSIDWGLTTLRDVLGFRTTSPTTKPAGQALRADDIAKFNAISSYLIHTDLVQSGIPVNAIDNAVIAKVFIDKAPGSLINYQPNNIPVANAQELIGSKRSSARFFLTDQRDNPVDTNGEFWSFTMVIRYYID